MKNTEEIRSILRNWLQSKDEIVFTDDIAISEVSDDIAKLFESPATPSVAGRDPKQLSYPSSKPVEVTDEMIEKEFPLDRTIILKKEYSSDLFIVQRNNSLRQEGAKWAISQMTANRRDELKPTDEDIEKWANETTDSMIYRGTRERQTAINNKIKGAQSMRNGLIPISQNTKTDE